MMDADLHGAAANLFMVLQVSSPSPFMCGWRCCRSPLPSHGSGWFRPHVEKCPQLTPKMGWDGEEGVLVVRGRGGDAPPWPACRVPSICPPPGLSPSRLSLASVSPRSDFHLCLCFSIWPPPAPPLYLLRSVNRFSSPKGHPSEISTLLMLPCYEQMPGRCPCQKFPAAVCVHALPAGLRSGISKGLNSQHPYLCWDTHACTGPMVHGISHHSDARTPPHCQVAAWRLSYRAPAAGAVPSSGPLFSTPPTNPAVLDPVSYKHVWLGRAAGR